MVVWLWYFRDVPAEHRCDDARGARAACPITVQRPTIVRPKVPWGALTRRMAPVTIVYFCYGWTLWLYLTWLPQYFLHEYRST